MSERVELRSVRLCLRSLCAEDADALAAYRALPVVARFQSWETFSLEDANLLIADQAIISPNTPGTWLQLALVLLETHSVIGDCGLHFGLEDAQQVELGMTLAPSHQGQGLATEALESVLDYVFDVLGKHRVSAVTDADNIASARLLRRVGFRQEAHHIENVWFKGEWGSEFVFALLHREWQERRNGNRGGRRVPQSVSGKY